ncbi:hypothetical protein [Skermanella sp. TT6]|uniref:hypothetical protein n=1 Tax=Skermanella cutis TaxID=2775420 RepID=UPI001FFF5C75|nr:hypothetical protein [Skermanella sp. TT6]
MNPIGVEPARDGPRALARGIHAEDPAYNLGLSLVDSAPAGTVSIVDHVIAVGVAAGDAALQNPAELAASGLVT